MRCLRITGYWLLVTGHWSLVTGRWLLAAGRWLLAAGRLSLVAGLWFRVSGVSAAVGRWNGQFDRKRNFEKANIEPRLGVDECRISKESILSIFKKSLSEAIPSFDIPYSTFFGSAVRFLTS